MGRLLRQAAAVGAGGGGATVFTITSGLNGGGFWYNRRGGATTGSVVGSTDVPGVGFVNRLGVSTGDLLINKGGVGSWLTWATANPGYEVRLTFLDEADAEIVLTAANQDGTPGGSFIRHSLTPAQFTLANNVSTGDRIRVSIAP